MEIACPNCAKRFRVPAEKLAPKGRKVRCAACGHVWFQAAAESAQPHLVSDDAEQWPRDPHRAEPGYDRPPIFDGPHLGEPHRFELSGDPDHAKPARRRSGLGLLLGWLLLVVVIAGLLAGGWYYRNQIVERVPQLQQLYDLAGVPLEAGHPGVELQDVTTQLNTVDGERVMTITGAVANISSQPREVPLLVATVTDPTGAVLVEWRFEAGKKQLAADEEVSFETRREAIPQGELSVRVDFVLP